jgi:hypothetical protein
VVGKPMGVVVLYTWQGPSAMAGMGVWLRIHRRQMWSAGHTEVSVEGQKCLSCHIKGCN